MYVGMCFATFCWHNEDHWSYSINYLHWGEPKTWYGVPGSKAECFEETMKQAAPELFQTQPDLLHQLVTIMNPNILMNAGVPVYRTDQHAGEFVITFPRAYHAGFNQGYNFAEAVNFAPADWLKMGRECITHYSHLRRFCVFSHDELVCKMALDPDKLDLTVAAATYQDMLIMVDNEKKMRKSLLEWGVTEAEREAFELLPDDERQCEVCKTTCFLSAMTCNCNSESLVCLRHYTSLCKCPPEKHTLRYRYTLDELPLMLQKLKRKAESFDNWVNLVKDALDPNTPKTMDLEQFKELIIEAEEKKFPKSDLLQTLISAVEDADKCSSVIQQLDLNKIRTRTRYCSDAKYKLTVEELRLFCEEIDSLACTLKEAANVKELLKQTQDFQQRSHEILNLELDKISPTDLEECIDSVSGFCIELIELKHLKTRLKQVNWLKETKAAREKSDTLTMEVVRNLFEAGMKLPPNSVLEKELAEIQALLTKVEEWEEKAKALIENQPLRSLAEVEEILDAATGIEAFLPSEENLRDLHQRATEWIKTSDEIHSGDNYPYFEAIEELIKKGRSVPVFLAEVERLESQYSLAKTWKERTARIFLRKNSPELLMEALSPRSFPDIDNSLKKLKLEGNLDPAQVVSAFKEAEECEIDSMKKLRQANIKKCLEDGNDNDVFCICRDGLSGSMLQCELCKDWFHTSCVTLSKNLQQLKYKNNCTNIIQYLTFRDQKYLCPECLRTRRPRLETILPLLVNLQKLTVRLPEGEALQCLTERAMNWQDRARQLLAMDELTQVMSTLSALSKKYFEAAAKEKTEKIITTELKRVANNPDLFDKVQQITAISGVPNENNDKSNKRKSDKLNGDDCVTEEHTYSLNAVEDDINGPLVVLNDSVKEQLEDLMMEGDLLEVSLDETMHIWKILQATKPLSEHDRLFIDFDVSNLLIN